MIISETRRNDIVWLLEHRNDHLPVQSRGSTPVAAPGFVAGTDEKGNPVRWVSCPDCVANDAHVEGKRGRSFGCETCGGRGEIPDEGPDPYAKNEKVLPFGFDSTRHDASHERDRKIEMLGRQTRPPLKEAELLEEANRRGYAWEELRRSMYRQYDFAELDRALDALRARDTDAGHAINAVYVDGWMADVGEQDEHGTPIITPLAEQLCERGLEFLSSLLPEQLRTGLHPAVARQRRRCAA